jgi:predicted transcriptional regulator
MARTRPGGQGGAGSDAVSPRWATLVGRAITDRDICNAAATRGLPPSHIAASDAMSQPVHACMAGDDVSEALSVMKQFRVRRLPVIEKSGVLKGVVSMNDLVAAAGRAKGPAAKDVLATLSAICAHRSKQVPAV